MPNKRPGTLVFPKDPLAAMRELQDLDADRQATGNTDTQATNSEDVNTTSSAVGNTTVGIEREPKKRETRRNPSSTTLLPVAEATNSKVGNATGSALPERQPGALETTNLPDDPLREAMLTMLARPYPGEPGKGPFTVTSVKIPTDVWDRLGWVSTLLDRPKQDIIAEALRRYFEAVRAEMQKD